MMKRQRNILVALILCILLVLSGCGTTEAEESPIYFVSEKFYEEVMRYFDEKNEKSARMTEIEKVEVGDITVDVLLEHREEKTKYLDFLDSINPVVASEDESAFSTLLTALLIHDKRMIEANFKKLHFLKYDENEADEALKIYVEELIAFKELWNQVGIEE